MKNRKKVAIAAGSLAAGLLAGLGFSAVGADQQPEHVSSSTDEPGAPPEVLGRLGNGKTYGFWAETTRDEDRPDYRPVDLSDGRRGYVKVSEAYPAIDEAMFGTGAEARKARAEYMAKAPKPDKDGNIWATVYDESGTKAIGRLVIAQETNPDKSLPE